MKSRTRRQGFTLMEIVIGIGLLAALALVVITAITYSSRAARINTNAIAAKNIAQGFFERMAIDDFADVGLVKYPNIDYDSAAPVWLDRALDIRCKVEFEFKGFGKLESANANSLTDADGEWGSNEWAGDVVYLVEGAGVGQFARIVSNTANSLTLIKGLEVIPDNNTKYLINGGKTVEITTTWEYMGAEYSQSIHSLIVNYRNGGNLGF